MTYTADQIPGNRLRVTSPVTVYLGSPGSSATETWQEGFLSPPVYSWVQRGGDIYWMIGELAPFRYVKHNPAALDVVADKGGAEFLADEEDTFSVAGLNDLLSLDSLELAGKLVMGAIALVLGIQLFSILKQ